MTPTWLICIQTAAIVISAIAAVLLVLSSRSQSKKRATVEMLLSLRLDSDYITLRNKFADLIATEDNLAQYASRQHSKHENVMLISRVLNYHEYIATGIFENAFDEEVYKRMAYSMCVRDWERLQGFVTELRVTQNMPTLFQEFETLAKKWKDNPLLKKIK